MTEEQFTRYKFRSCEPIIFHQRHPTMDVEMMLLAVDFENEILKLAPIYTNLYEDNAIWVNREFCDKPRAIMKIVKCKKQRIMEDEQKLKLLRLSVDNASNFGEAKEYASFIFGFKEPFETRTPSDDEEEDCKHEYIEPIIEDGVYIVEKGFLPLRFEDAAGVQNPKECDVMVSYHGHKWIVAKEDLKGEELPLFSDGSHPEYTSSLYKREIEALNDFDMKSCTEHLRKAGITFELDADLYIPTAGQLAAMFLFRRELNEALEMVGGTPMKEEVYWSSSEYYAWISWLVSFDSGSVGNWGGKCLVSYVRPCTAFEL